MKEVLDRFDRRECPEPSRLRIRPLARDELRSLDQKAEDIGLSTLVLMENAGRGAARVLNWAIGETGLLDDSLRIPRVLLVCGPGNNGGDGAVMARHLDSTYSASVDLVWVSAKSDLKGLAPTQQKILENTHVREHFLGNYLELDAFIEKADWIVDCLFGTGMTRGISSESMAGQIITRINSSQKPVLAMDIPSGLDADTGEPSGECVRALITASFVAMKTGFLNEKSCQWTGRVEIVEIGLPIKLLKPFEVK